MHALYEKSWNNALSKFMGFPYLWTNAMFLNIFVQKARTVMVSFFGFKLFFAN
jgi:hypothetical protein